MKRTKLLALIHLIVLIALIAWNYYSNTGIIRGNTVGSVSDQYDNLFTPAGYTFAIWGLIYLALLYLAGYYLYCAFSKKEEDKFILKSAPWLILAHLFNGAWLWFWLHEQTGISVLVIFGILAFLMIAVINLNMERWDAPVKHMAGVWWPIDLYAGWIAVAAIANVAAHLSAVGWISEGSEISWTVGMIVFAALLNLFMIFSRNMREFAAVGVWAFIGIAVRHWGEIPEIQWTATCSAFILFITIGLHAYKNRATLPFIKLRNQ
ncbi:MAG: tryptophan-rich sensory protein [Crocinitomicaceae bacterium]